MEILVTVLQQGTPDLTADVATAETQVTLSVEIKAVPAHVHLELLLVQRVVRQEGHLHGAAPHLHHPNRLLPGPEHTSDWVDSLVFVPATSA